jgi:hypothetical protein
LLYFINISPKSGVIIQNVMINDAHN